MVSKTALVFLLACVFQGYNALPTQSEDLQELLKESEAIIAKIDNFPIKTAELETAAETEIARMISTQFLSNRGIADLPAVKCALDQVDTVKKIVAETHAAVKKCVEAAASVIGQLKPQLDALREKLVVEIKKAKPIVTKCVKDNLLNPAAAVACVKTEGAEVRAAIVKLAQELKELADSQVDPILVEAVKCVKAALSSAHTQAQSVVADVKNCIASSKN